MEDCSYLCSLEEDRVRDVFDAEERDGEREPGEDVGVVALTGGDRPAPLHRHRGKRAPTRKYARTLSANTQIPCQQIYMRPVSKHTNTLSANMHAPCQHMATCQQICSRPGSTW